MLYVPIILCLLLLLLLFSKYIFYVLLLNTLELSSRKNHTFIYHVRDTHE